MGRFVGIQDVAVALRSHCEAQKIRPDLDLNVILDGLCWLAFERGGNTREGGKDGIARWNEEENYSTQILISFRRQPTLDAVLW